MKYHSINGEIWQDTDFKSFSSEAKLLFLYLYSNKDCPPSGMYKKEIDEMAFNLRWKEDVLLRTLKELDGKWISYDFSRGVVWIKGKIKYNMVSDKFKDNKVKAISRDLLEFKNCNFIQEFFDSYPEFVDIAIHLEQIKKKQNTTTGGC